ncbi:MAG: hypothetical protein ABW227_08665 [Gaiellaceae bacterium]|jgi:hypothetical protein
MSFRSGSRLEAVRSPMSGGSEHDLDAGGAQSLELAVGAIQPEGDAARRLELLHRDKP